MNYLIEEQSQLTELAPLFSKLSEQSGMVAIDTEFFREKTYSAKLCLVQLGIDEHQYCIDVLAIDDLSLLIELFGDVRITKIFHAARQDLEVIFQTLGVMPTPIFDTQLAAAFCGLDMQIGYAALVEERLGIELGKSQARTDWTKRPLSEEQLAYAGDDVAYLGQIYQAAKAELVQVGKYDWYLQEIDSYYDTTPYVADPVLAYKRLSGGGLNLIQQYTLKALAEWREASAQQRDIPRNWVLRDDRLFDLAIKRPTSVDEVLEMSVFGRKSAKHLAPKAAQVIASVQVGDEPLWTKVEPLNKQQKGVCSAMMKRLKELAEQHSVAQALLGTRRDIESLYRHGRSGKLLNGWREELVGKPLQVFLATQSA